VTRSFAVFISILRHSGTIGPFPKKRKKKEGRKVSARREASSSRDGGHCSKIRRWPPRAARCGRGARGRKRKKEQGLETADGLFPWVLGAYLRPQGRKEKKKSCLGRRTCSWCGHFEVFLSQFNDEFRRDEKRGGGGGGGPTTGKEAEGRGRLLFTFLPGETGLPAPREKKERRKSHPEGERPDLADPLLCLYHLDPLLDDLAEKKKRKKKKKDLSYFGTQHCRSSRQSSP